jgi:hypothetical protein
MKLNLKNDIKYRNTLSFNNYTIPTGCLIEMSSQPFSLQIMSRFSSREPLIICTEFRVPLWKFHGIFTDFGTVRPQAVTNKSECSDEVKRKGQNPDTLAKNTYTDFTGEHACFITKLN